MYLHLVLRKVQIGLLFSKAAVVKIEMQSSSSYISTYPTKTSQIKDSVSKVRTRNQAKQLPRSPRVPLPNPKIRSPRVPRKVIPGLARSERLHWNTVVRATSKQTWLANPHNRAPLKFVYLVMKAPWRCQVERTLSPFKDYTIWDSYFSLGLSCTIFVWLKLMRSIVQDWGSVESEGSIRFTGSSS